MTSEDAREFIHVVAAVIWHPQENNSLLISRRKKGTHLADYWELPGGKLEQNETRSEGLERELYEELGIKAIDSEAFMQVRHCYADRNILLDVWTVNLFTGEITGRENQEIRWIPVNEIDSYEFPEADIPVLSAIKSSVIT